METTLSRVILPGEDRAAQYALYYRPSGAVQVEEDGLRLQKGSSVRFNSYFNAFFYPKYLAYTTVEEITLCLSVRGRARLRILCALPGGRESVLHEEDVCEGETRSPAFRLSCLPPGGMLFFELEARSGSALFLGGRYETSQAPENDVKVAAVICTYRREAYVTRNLEQMEETVWKKADCPIREQIDVFAVDNGRTLTLEENAHIRLFPNKNCGGSGGFTRGLIEARKRRPLYTHVLFMDDDISFETETLIKTIQLLRYARAFERPLCIGGQMLLEDEPTIQFEAGAFYRKGRLEAVNQGLELSEPDRLLENEAERHVQYNAWWYCCIPLEAVERIGLPLPLFIKTDDVEYGLRMRPHILLMNGIGVWHQRFDRKYSIHLEYYIKRNELIVSALHGSGAGVWPSLWKLIRASAKAVLTGETGKIGFMLRAYRDFLQGPDFFLQTDGEKLNAQLLEEMKKPSGSRLRGALSAPWRLLPVTVQTMLRYGEAVAQYQRRAAELTNETFWRRYLGIGEEDAAA